nr:unnamed protein product [Haemonchus contortus]
MWVDKSAAPEMVRACTEKITGTSNTEAMELELKASNHEEAQRERWRDVIKKDLAEAKITEEDAVDRQKRRRLTRALNPATGRINAREKKKKNFQGIQGVLK